MAQHDSAVSYLDSFEDLRYPPDHSFAITLQWDGPTYPSQLPANTKLYTLLVSDIDALVADIFRTTGWNTGLFFKGVNLAMLDVLTFLNDQKEYLREVAGSQ